MAIINHRAIAMLELKNKIDKLMEEYEASFGTMIDKDGFVKLVLFPTGPYIDCGDIVVMFNQKNKS